MIDDRRTQVAFLLKSVAVFQSLVLVFHRLFNCCLSASPRRLSSAIPPLSHLKQETQPVNLTWQSACSQWLKLGIDATTH